METLEPTNSPVATTTQITPSAPKHQTLQPTFTPKPVSKIQISEEELRGSVIRFWHNWSGPAGDVVAAIIEDFNLNNPWKILAVEIYQGNLDQINTEMISTKHGVEKPDLLVGYLHQAAAWDETLGVVDLNDYLADPVWGYSVTERAEFSPVFWEYDVIKGKRLGVPAQRSGYVLFYNQTWARELGFQSVPLSAEEFTEQACAAALVNNTDIEKENDGTGGWVISIEYPAILSWMYAFDAVIYRDNQSTPLQDFYQFDQPEVIHAYEFLKDLFDQGCAWLPENPSPETYFSERRALLASGSITDIPFFLDAMQRAGNTDEWTVLAYPGQDGLQTIDVYGTSFLVLKSTEKQQLAAWLLMKWLLKPEHQASLIQSTYAIPLRASEEQYLNRIKSQQPEWATAIDLLEKARVEPKLHSWSLVRWAVSDSAVQLFRSYTTLDQIPALVRYLNQTAAELHEMSVEEQ